MKHSIIVNHYQSILTNLVNPTVQVTAYPRKPLFTVPNVVTANSLVYVCVPQTDRFCANPNTQAGVTGEDANRPAYFGTTVLGFCPIFFRGVLHQTMLNAYRTDLTVLTSLSGTLVHEVQHMARATTLDALCIDVPNPFWPWVGRSEKCYSPTWYKNKFYPSYEYC